MSIDVELAEYFLDSGSDVIYFDCFELSHSMFSQTYFFVRNATNGLTVTHEDSSTREYQYAPVRFTFEQVRTDLEQIMKIEFGDVGEILPNELDLIRAGGGFEELPELRYRAYRSDDLTVPLEGPVLLEVRTLNFNRQGCNFEAKAPSLNVSRTGERFTIGRFPMLKGLL